ncbi:MAG: hypothetical protein P1V21_24355 [Rhizobiaceae bacterium]|nr:hypothetical protein [Rhizobiaceae bacterium]
MSEYFTTAIIATALGLLLAGPVAAETVCIDVDGPLAPFKFGPPGASFNYMNEQQKWAFIATLASKVNPPQADRATSFSVLLKPDGTASIGTYKHLQAHSDPDVELQTNWSAVELGETFETTISQSAFAIDGKIQWQELQLEESAFSDGAMMPEQRETGQ